MNVEIESQTLLDTILPALYHTWITKLEIVIEHLCILFLTEKHKKVTFAFTPYTFSLNLSQDPILCHPFSLLPLLLLYFIKTWSHSSLLFTWWQTQLRTVKNKSSKVIMRPWWFIVSLGCLLVEVKAAHCTSKISWRRKTGYDSMLIPKFVWDWITITGLIFY